MYSLEEYVTILFVHTMTRICNLSENLLNIHWADGDATILVIH